jgi:plastocyanin
MARMRLRARSYTARRATIASAALAVGALGVFAGFACSSGKDAPTAPLRSIEECISAIVPPTTGAQKVIALRNYTYGPDSINIAAGTTVTWANCEPANIDPHTATARAGEWQSGYLAPGAIYSRQFNAAGRFEYFCEPHPFMHGVIIVE